jgi:hypothetical protein
VTPWGRVKRRLLKPFPPTAARATLSNGAVVPIELHEHPEYRSRESVRYHWDVHEAYVDLLPPRALDVDRPLIGNRQSVGVYATAPDGRMLNSVPQSVTSSTEGVELDAPTWFHARALLDDEDANPVLLRESLRAALHALDRIEPTMRAYTEAVEKSRQSARVARNAYYIAIPVTLAIAIVSALW